MNERNVNVSVTASSFPPHLFLEWDADCKLNFGDCRWMKMWFDHLCAKQIRPFGELYEELANIKVKLRELEEKPEEPQTIKTLTEEIEIERGENID